VSIDSLKAIIGLGNPGREYAVSRHNAGFMVADRLVESCSGSWKKGHGKGVTAKIEIAGRSVLVGKSHTFMNLSGSFVQAQMAFYRLEPQDVLIVYDEMDLPLGKIRMARGGGTAGHRGMESIVAAAGRKDLPRLRIGIGKPEGERDVVGFVLDRFSPEERFVLDAVLAEAEAAARTWIACGIESAMNRHNAFSLPGEADKEVLD